MMFLEYLGPDDLTENYAFTVKYQPGEDISLDEHTDASTITVNVCLQPASPSDGKLLYFKEQRTFDYKNVNAKKNRDRDNNSNGTYLELVPEPGYALIHLGQHVHGVSPVKSPRSQLVVWLFGDHGYVRVAPYEPHEIKMHQKLYDSFWKKKPTKATIPGMNGKEEL